MRNFGPLSAEGDNTLLEYFHVTKQVHGILDFKRPQSAFILIARPGSGKTAVKKFLSSRATTDLTVTISSERVRLYVEDEEKLNSGDLRLLLTNVLFTALLSEAIEEKLFSGSLRAEAEGLLSQGWTSLGRFFKEKFVGMSILGVGFSLKPSDRRQYLQDVRQKGRLDEIADLLGKLASKKRVLLVVDNPEEIVGTGWADITEENAIRVGAFLSVLARTNSLGVRVVCLVKEQILQAVRNTYPDYSHFADQLEGLSWLADDLVEMLDSRVVTLLKSKWSDVFDLDKASFTTQVLPYLSNGPRDLLFLCNTAGRTSDKLGVRELLAGVKPLRTERLNDLSSQYKQWPRFDRLTAAMAEALHDKFRSGLIPNGGINSAFIEQYSKPQSAIHRLRPLDWMDRARYENPAVMDQRLFVAGIVGFLRDGEKVYPWTGRDIASFQSAEWHFVSPLFIDAEGLGIPPSSSRKHRREDS